MRPTRNPPGPVLMSSAGRMLRYPAVKPPPLPPTAVSDEELFEDNPQEYIRRDVEGSDVDTRRRAACDLVKALSRLFEQRITQEFAQYVQVSPTSLRGVLRSRVTVSI